MLATFDLTLVVGLLVVLILCVSKFNSYSLWYKSIFQNSCTDSYLTLLLQNYETKLNKCYYDLVVCTVLDILVLVFGVLFVVFRCCGGDLRWEQTVRVEGDNEEDDRNRMMPPPDSSEVQLKDKDLKLDENVVIEDDLERDTRDNFYNIYAVENELGVKKKRKKKLLKKRNLFKKIDSNENSKLPE